MRITQQTARYVAIAIAREPHGNYVYTTIPTYQQTHIGFYWFSPMKSIDHFDLRRIARLRKTEPNTISFAR